MRTFPDNSFDQVIYSPVYWLRRKYNGLGNGNEKTFEEYNAYLQQVFDESLRVVKPDGTVVVILGDQWVDGSQFFLPYRFAITARDRTRAKVINDVTWEKLNAMPAFARRLANCGEQVFVFAKTDDYHFDPTPFMDAPRRTPKPTKRLGQHYRMLIDRHLVGDQRRAAHEALDRLIEQVKSGEIVGFRMKIRGAHTLAWRGWENGASRAMLKSGFHAFRLRGGSIARNIVAHAVASRKGGTHPAVLPVGLAKMFIDAFCKPGGHTCDPFMGSGTSAIAALETGRTFTGIEIDPEYHTDSVKTLKAKNTL